MENSESNDIKELNIKDKFFIKDSIKQLTKHEYIEIFKICLYMILTKIKILNLINLWVYFHRRD